MGLAEADPRAVAGGTPAGERRRRARRSWAARPARGADLVLLNAGAAIYAGGRADTIAEGVDAAREAHRLGRRARTTEAYLSLSKELASA